MSCGLMGMDHRGPWISTYARCIQRDLGIYDCPDCQLCLTFWTQAWNRSPKNLCFFPFFFLKDNGNYSSGVRRPRATFNTKYGTKGGFEARMLANVRGPPQLVATLAEAPNNGLASNTWKSYRTAANHVERIRKELGIRLSFPFSLEVPS